MKGQRLRSIDSFIKYLTDFLYKQLSYSPDFNYMQFTQTKKLRSRHKHLSQAKNFLTRLYYNCHNTYYSQMMTDEEEQEVTRFRRKVNHLKIEFELISEEKAFTISILNLERLKSYDQKVDATFIQERQGLFFIFETARDLMKYMVHHFKDLNVKDDGCIEFSINFSEIMKPRLVVIRLREKQMDKIDLMNLKMEIMKDQFNEKLEKKEAAIEALKGQNQTLQEQVKNLKNCFFYTHAHPQGYQNQYFLTKYTGKSLIVNHIGQNTNYIFVFNHEIAVGTIKKYVLKVLKSGSITNVTCGFGTRHILSNSSYNGAEIATYRYDGNLFEGGPQRNVGVASAVGDQLQCQLNSTENTITWTKNKNLFGTTTLPQQMRNKALFFALNFHSKFDEIQVMLT